MAKTGSVRGDIIIGESGIPEVAIPLSQITGTVAQQSSGKLKVVANTTVSIPFGSISNAQMLFISIVNNSTKVPVSRLITLNSAGTPIALLKQSCILWISQSPTGTALASASVTADNDGIDLEIEWVVTGT